MDINDKLKDNFDCIIAVNSAFKYFDDIIDFHIIVEKVSPTSSNKIFEELNSNVDIYSKTTPRLFNWKGIGFYDQSYNIHKLTRSNFNHAPNVREYVFNKSKGLLTGPASDSNFALGSVTLGAMHFAGILGARDIYLIGADMFFRNEYDHFYNDKMYTGAGAQSHIKEKNRVKVVDIDFNGKSYKTTDYFRDSAKCIDDMINGPFADAGISVHDFSNGLLKSAIAEDISKYIK